MWFSDISIGIDESCATSMEDAVYSNYDEMETSPHLPTLSHAKEQQEDMELTENKAYYIPTNIPVEPNQCCGIPDQEEYYDYVR